MNHLRSSFFAVRAWQPTVVLPVLLALAAAHPAEAGAQVPAEYQGTWVPAKATCESPARVVITADKLTLINLKDTQAIGGIEMAGPSYWGPDYNGIMAVLITEFEGQQPVTASFNVGEKKGVAQVEFAPVMPGGNPSQAAYNARITQLNLAKRFPLNKVPLKKCAGASGAEAGGGAAPARQASGKPAGPSVCAGKPHCTEVAPFAAMVTDFRTSTAGATKVVTINMRFQNRTGAPLILGYVQGSGIVTDDRGNRYAVAGQGAVRGIGEINNNTFDPKFTLQPGEASDARIEFQWTPQRGQIFGTTYGVELAVREIESLPAEQYQLGKEYALKLDGFTAGTPVASAAQPGGAVAPAAGAAAGAAAIPADAPDACAGKQRCYNAGPFAAEVTQVTTSKVTYYVVVKLNVKVRNVTAQPLLLGWQNGSGSAIDDVGNRYVAKTVKGIGLVSASSADPQFALNPGQSRAFTVEYVFRANRSTVGTSWTADFVLQQLEILPSRQVRSVREFAVSYQNLTAGTSSVGAAAGTDSSATDAAHAANATAGAAAIPADAPDACAGKQRCYNAGPFAAEVTQVTTSKVTYYVVVKLNVKVRNVTAQPLLLGWQNGSGSAIDDVGNRYVAKTVKGIGLVSATSADPQFALNPGQSRAFTVEYVFRANRSTVGTSWTADFVLQQLEILPSRQVRSVREFAVSYQNLTAGTSSVGAAAGTDSSATDAANAVNATAGAVNAVGKLFKSK